MVVGSLSDAEVDRLFHALADATRRDILQRCIGGEPSVSRLADGYPMSFAAVQKHVAVLERAGLVVKERRGREQLVRTDGDAVVGRGGCSTSSRPPGAGAWSGWPNCSPTCPRRTPRMTLVSVEKDVDRLTLTLVAEFDAPIDRVWELWADPRQLERWWGPPSHPATVEKHHLRVDGEVGYYMTGPDGERSHGWWRVTSLDPPASLDFTDGFAHRTGPRTRTRRPPRCGSGSPSATAGPGWSCASASPPASTWSGCSAGARSTSSRSRSARWTRCSRLTTKRSQEGSHVRKIKSYFFISLDGVVEAPDQWHFPYFDDEMGAAVGAGFAGVDAMLMGRTLYEEWAAFWPENADQPFGDVINPMKKYVISNSLSEATWENTEVDLR